MECFEQAELADDVNFVEGFQDGMLAAADFGQDGVDGIYLL